MEMNDKKYIQALLDKFMDSNTSREEERILKEYIAGATVAELLRVGQMEPDWPEQVRAMCRRLYPAGLNIDYYPTNFVVQGDRLYYIDFECNDYMAEWDFEHWGVQYWSKTPAFLQYVKEHRQ